MENGKLIKYFAKMGEVIEISDDELPFFEELEAKAGLAEYEKKAKQERDEELKITLGIRKMTDAMRYQRLSKRGEI